MSGVGDGFVRKLARSVRRQKFFSCFKKEAASHEIRSDAPEVSSRQRKDGVDTFDQAEYQAINRARIAHLASLRFDLAGKTVLDVGCGIGHLAQHFVSAGSRVICLDAREENIAALLLRYPSLAAHVADVERDDLCRYGEFDVVFCYGLLYHLENPIAALRNMASVCKEMLLLETMVCDYALPLVRLAPESAAFSQALRGLGCRPTPPYVVSVLRRVGFPYVCNPKHPPEYPDFLFEPRNNLDITRDHHPLRRVFVATRVPLTNQALVLAGDDS